MHKQKKNGLKYYAKILLVISITLFLYGIASYYINKYNILDPIKDVIVEDEEYTISITTSDGSEIVPGNTITKTKEKSKNKDKDKTSENNTSNTTENTNNGNNNTNNNTEKNSGNGNNSSNNSSNNSGKNNNPVVTPQPQPEPQPAPEPAPKTINDINNDLRNNIQDSYGIKVMYGSETSGYAVAGLTTNPISDANVANDQLNRLNNTLSKYPSGMFSEINRGGIPLTILLINNYSEDSVTGVTDSSYSYAHISIAASHPFEESFYHESYHYIERYIFKRGANFNSWDSLNPDKFQGWGIIDGSLSYNVTFNENAPFVNNYAQTSGAEDRASTFEYMMADSKASCLNNGNTVWRKAIYMSRTIEAVYSSASSNNVEYWERFL